MERKMLNEIKEDLFNLKKKFPSWVNDRLIFINGAITFSIVIKDVDKLLQKQIKQLLENEGYSDFQEKTEDSSYTIVFQNNGFKQIENLVGEMNNYQSESSCNTSNIKINNLNENDKEYFLNVIKDLNEKENKYTGKIYELNNIIFEKQKKIDYFSGELNKLKNEIDHQKNILMEDSIKYYEENLQLKTKQLKESEKTNELKDFKINQLENQILQLELQMKKNKEVFIHRDDIEGNFIEKKVFSDKLKKIIYKEEKLPLILCILGVPQEALEENLCDYIMEN